MSEVKINGDVAFYEENHVYVNTKVSNLTYLSVTTLVKHYHEQFDNDFWSGYKALEGLMKEDFEILKSYLLDRKKIDFDVTKYVSAQEYNTLKEEISAGYDKKRIESAAIGTKIHKEKEETFYTSKNINLKDCGFLLHDGVYACEKNNFDLNREKAVLPEYLVYYSDEIFHVNLAGQIDLLIKDGNDLYIYDYKTNAEGIESKAYFDRKKKQSKKMFYPVNDLEDCKLVHYTLQLSIYAWMLQQINPEFKIKRLCLIHIDRNRKETEIDVQYDKDSVERIIKDYSKKLKVKKLKGVV